MDSLPRTAKQMGLACINTASLEPSSIAVLEYWTASSRRVFYPHTPLALLLVGCASSYSRVSSGLSNYITQPRPAKHHLSCMNLTPQLQSGFGPPAAEVGLPCSRSGSM